MIFFHTASKRFDSCSYNEPYVVLIQVQDGVN